MATVQSLKKKLRTVSSTVKVTRAMKTASTVKYSKLSAVYSEYCKYSDEYLHLYEAYRAEFNSAFNCTNPDAPCCYVVITSNKGMCGGFNNELLAYFSDMQADGVVVCCGRKGTEFFEKKKIKAEKSFIFDDIPSYEQVQQLFDFICTLMQNGRISAVKTVYPQYVNMMKQKPVCRDLFSFEQSGSGDEDIIFVPDKETIIKTMSDKILMSVLYKRVLETALGAQAATLAAMRSAYDTACEYRDKLATEMNRKRQSQVTADVIESSSEFSVKGDI